MTRLTPAALALALVAQLVGGAGPAAAATAHNSQAGAYGPTTNNAGHTYRRRKPPVAAPKG